MPLECGRGPPWKRQGAWTPGPHGPRGPGPGLHHPFLGLPRGSSVQSASRKAALPAFLLCTRGDLDSAGHRLGGAFRAPGSLRYGRHAKAAFRPGPGARQAPRPACRWRRLPARLPPPGRRPAPSPSLGRGPARALGGVPRSARGGAGAPEEPPCPTPGPLGRGPWGADGGGGRQRLALLGGPPTGGWDRGPSLLQREAAGKGHPGGSGGPCHFEGVCERWRGRAPACPRKT